MLTTARPRSARDAAHDDATAARPTGAAPAGAARASAPPATTAARPGASSYAVPRDALRETRRQRGIRALAMLAVVAICGLVTWHVAERLGRYGWRDVSAVYTVLVTGYVLSRFVLAALYRAPRDAGITPSVAIIVPAYNEGAAVRRTVEAG